MIRKKTEQLKTFLVIVFLICCEISVYLWRLFRPKRFRYLKNIRGQSVVVVGAGNDLGRLLSKKFAKLGANLILIDTDNLGMEDIINDVRRKKVRATSIVCDMTKDGIYRIAEQVYFFFS